MTGSFFERRLARSRLFLLGGLLGLCAFLLIYGTGPLHVSDDSWLRGGFVEQDVIQHYTGWLFYRNSPLGLPLCIAPGINWPQGLSVAFTDSIPLFAALFRLLSPLLPATFQYFGLFAAICFCLQGGFAALLLSLFFDRWPCILIGSLFFIFSPIMVERAFRHTSLTAHFLILGALFYYFQSLLEGRYAFKGLFALNCLSICIHPYFVPMLYAVTFALLAQYCVRRRVLLRPAAYLASNLAGTLAAAWLFGLFTGGSASESGGILSYGFFCMNLNALWNPTSQGGAVWSRILPVQNQILGNYDGFNYLGVGLLAALAFVLAVCLIYAVRKRLNVKALLLRHWCLLLVCMCLTVFAVSNVVTANGATLAQIPLPYWLLKLASALRSSGRMFWPVYYLLTIVAVVGVGRFFTPRRAAAALALVIALQLWDISPALAGRRRMMVDYEPQFTSSLDSPFWKEAAERYQHIITLDDFSKDTLFFALYAVDNRLTTNDPFAARADQTALKEQREQVLEQLLAGQADPTCLYVTDDEGLFLSLAPLLENIAWCGRVDELHYVIAPGMRYDGSDGLAYSDDWPVCIADYSDSNWDKGVLTWDMQTVMFPDAPLIRQLLETAGAVRAGGIDYRILKVDDKDAGTLMVTLDIPDATVLQGVVLEFVP